MTIGFLTRMLLPDVVITIKSRRKKEVLHVGYAIEFTNDDRPLHDWQADTTGFTLIV